MSKKIESVFGIIFSECQTKIVLIKRRDVPVWVLPGGGVESNETPEESVMREVKEETGLEVEIVRQVAHYLPSRPFLKPTNLYACKIVSGKLIDEGSEVKNVGFFDLDQLPLDLMPPPFHEYIEDTLKNAVTLEKNITSLTPLSFVKNIVMHPIYSTRFILSRLGLHINT